MSARRRLVVGESGRPELSRLADSSVPESALVTIKPVTFPRAIYIYRKADGQEPFGPGRRYLVPSADGASQGGLRGLEPAQANYSGRFQVETSSSWS